MKSLMLLLLLCSPAWGQFAQVTTGAVENDKKFIMRGSGTLIRSDILITAAHCVTGDDLTVQFGEKSFPGIVLAEDVKADIALVQLPHIPGQIPVSIGTVSLGESVRIGGFGGQNAWQYQSGKVTSRALNLEGGLCTTISGVFPRKGDSGGPVLDNQGNLVAVIFAQGGEIDEVTKEPVPGTQFAWAHEFQVFLNKHVPEASWEHTKGVKPYQYVKLRESMLPLLRRNMQLEVFIEANELLLPPHIIIFPRSK